MTLDCLTRLEYPAKRWEVVVVDDGSVDTTPQVLGAFSDKLPLRWWSTPNRGAGAARNRALREAHGMFALFVDDDVLVPRDLLYLHRESHGSHLRLLVRGPVINFAQLPPPSPPDPDQLWRHFSMNYLCTSNASLLRESLFEAGLFNEELERWEDAELAVRLKRIGIRRVFNNQAYVLHYKPPVEWDSRCQTASRDGRSAALLYRQYPSLRMRLRSGLHGANEWRNRLLLSGPGRVLLDKLPNSAKIIEDLQLERIYLDSGRKALES
jgi:glycosyltransferase involved in cell wall biosynthesis